MSQHSPNDGPSNGEPTSGGQVLDGPALFRIVENYWALGDHRSGSLVERTTADWMAAMLGERGLEVTTETEAYERWVAAAELTVSRHDGERETIDCLALADGWTGDIETDEVDVVASDPQSGGFPDVVRTPVDQAIALGGEAAVLVTEHPNGSLVGINRAPESPGGSHPVVLAAGRDLQALRSGTVSLRMDARLEPGEIITVVARTPAGMSAPTPPLILTTPLTGWFGCAGERGTGLAVLLALVERFRHRNLLVVATGGHELSYLGAHRWVGIHPDAEALAIVHVGASVAVIDPTGELVETRLAMTSLDERRTAPLAAALAPIGLEPQPATTGWIGEGEAWSRLGAPMMSTTGAGIDFHTPEDTPARATSPQALARVATAMGDATEALIAAAEAATRHSDDRTPSLRSDT